MAVNDGQSGADKGLVELWVKSAVESSSDFDERYTAKSIIGEPSVYPKYGDHKGTWAQKNLLANEFITVEFEEQLYVSVIEIYETYNAGGVFRISAFDNFSDKWIVVWSAKTAKRIEKSRIFSPTIEELAFTANRFKLEVDCTIAKSWVELDSVKIKGTRLPSNKPSTSELSANLKQLLSNPLFSDVTFLVEDKEIPAHKAILSTRSGYFQTLLTNGILEADKPIKLTDITSAGFLAMLHYIYTNDFDPILPTQVTTELIRIGDKISLLSMKTLGRGYLSKNITVDNVIDIYRNATEQLPRLDEVENLTLDFIAKHLTKVSVTVPFTNLTKDVMLAIIQAVSSRLNLN